MQTTSGVKVHTEMFALFELFPRITLELNSRMEQCDGPVSAPECFGIALMFSTVHPYSTDSHTDPQVLTLT